MKTQPWYNHGEHCKRLHTHPSIETMFRGLVELYDMETSNCKVNASTFYYTHLFHLGVWSCMHIHVLNVFQKIAIISQIPLLAYHRTILLNMKCKK